MTQVFVVKTVDEDTWEPIPGVFEELEAGRARIGWSWLDHLDLRLIQEKINTGEPLDGDEQSAKRCLGFLTRVGVDDYLLYPHQPNRGNFCLVQVMDEYDYSSEEDGLDGFRSFRPCSFLTSVDMDDEIVPSQLRHRLGRPGRFSQVYDTVPFREFLDDLPEAGSIRDDSNRASLRKSTASFERSSPTRSAVSLIELIYPEGSALIYSTAWAIITSCGKALTNVVPMLSSPWLIVSCRIRSKSQSVYRFLLPRAPLKSGSSSRS